MKQVTTLFLKLAVIFIGIPVLALGYNISLQEISAFLAIDA